jgi:hypothetical protein
VKIVFLSYINRSGSTFLANALSKSPDVCVCPEAEILYDIFLQYPDKQWNSELIEIRRALKILQGDRKFKLWNLNDDVVKSVLQNKRTRLEIFLDILKLYQERNNMGAKIILYKHTWMIKLIPRLDESIIQKLDLNWILLIRDIRAVYASQKNTISPLTHKPMCTNCYSLAKDWNYFASEYLKLSANNNVIFVQYEDLIGSTGEKIEQITNTLKIPFNLNWIREKKGKVFELLSSDYQQIHGNIDLEPTIIHVDKWRKILTNKQVTILTILGITNLERFKYPIYSFDSKIQVLFYPEIFYMVLKHYMRLFNNLVKNLVHYFIYQGFNLLRNL